MSFQVTLHTLLQLVLVLWCCEGWAAEAADGVSLRRTQFPSADNFLKWASEPVDVGCSVAILLHIPKTGGTTVAEEVFSFWQQALGFRVFRYRLTDQMSMSALRDMTWKGLPGSLSIAPKASWSQLAQRLNEIALDRTNHTDADLRHFRLAIELHFCLGLRAVSDQINSFRPHLTERGCSVKVMTLFREPVDHQLSWLGER